ncbi:hypothetical protein RCOM_1508040 [Ricinus communis]|uniref:Uncharacterized protein n=1 Tax=Ricinus communis TaxID=3988 RepID=B9RAR2_RICCO|nr:hypothetical protein RCOM_1508040 [Ricinus communis]
MTISATPSIKDECLTVRGKVVLRDVPPSVVVSPASDESAFHGAAAASPNSYHVFNLGILEAQDDMPLQVKNLVVDTKFWKFRTRCACRNTNASYRSKGRVYSGCKRPGVTGVSEDFTQMSLLSDIAYCHCNNLLQGEIVVPDWDMFYSDDYMADSHAAARAIGGVCSVCKGWQVFSIAREQELGRLVARYVRTSESAPHISGYNLLRMLIHLNILQKKSVVEIVLHMHSIQVIMWGRKKSSFRFLAKNGKERAKLKLKPGKNLNKKNCKKRLHEEARPPLHIIFQNALELEVAHQLLTDSIMFKSIVVKPFMIK